MKKFLGIGIVVLVLFFLINEFSDYRKGYKDGYNAKAKTKHIIPVEMSKKNLEKVLNIALKAHNSIGCKGVTRSDFKFYKNRFFLLETNTQPGMTKLSLVPEIAAYAGMSFINLIEWILKDASTRR